MRVGYQGHQYRLAALSSFLCILVLYANTYFVEEKPHPLAAVSAPLLTTASAGAVFYLWALHLDPTSQLAFRTPFPSLCALGATVVFLCTVFVTLRIPVAKRAGTLSCDGARRVLLVFTATSTLSLFLQTKALSSPPPCREG